MKKTARSMKYELTIVFSLLLATMLNGQTYVIIKERIEISPSEKISHRVNSGDISLFLGTIVPDCKNQSFLSTRPCKIVGTGTLTILKPGMSIPVAILLETKSRTVNITNGTDSLTGYCGAEVRCYLYNWTSCGIFDNVNVSGDISDNQATFEITADWNCQAGNIVPIRANITITGIPSGGDPSTFTMNPTTTTLVANEKCHTQCAYFYVRVRDNSGNPFEICGPTARITFTIENPIAGVYFQDGTQSGISLSIEFAEGESCGKFYWDGGVLPDSVYDISVRAEGFGLSAVQSIRLIKVYLDHFDVITNPDTVPRCTYSYISLLPVDNLGNGYPIGDIDDSTSIILTAEPDTGFFRPTVTTYKDFKDRRVYYNPFFETEEIQDILITAVGNGTSGTGKVTVWGGESCPLIQLSATEMNPGDTVTITMIASYWYHTQEPYPPDQKFDIKLNTGEAYGRLYSPSPPQEGSELSDVLQPIYFIAANAIDVDSAEVEIEVWPKSESPTAMISGGNRDTVSMQERIKILERERKMSIEGKVAIVTSQMSKMAAQDEAQPLVGRSAFPDQKVNKTQQILSADPPCSPKGWVTIKREVDRFIISLNHDTLRNRDVAVITVIAVDKDNNEVHIDTMSAINLMFLDLNQYVDFISVTNDTLDELTNVSYGELRAGRVKVIARGTEGGGPVAAVSYPRGRSQISSTTSATYRIDYPSALISATLANDATKIGFCDFYLMPEMKVIAVADSIKPTYRNRYGVYVIPAIESCTEVKFVTTISGVLYNGPPYQLELTSYAVEGSGGHFHTGNRPTGRLIDSGDTLITFYKPTTGDTIRMTYQASIFGGIERIKARLIDLPQVLADSDFVVVRVPNLQLLSDGINYRKTGGRCAHHGPSIKDTVEVPILCRTPDDNHYGTQRLIQILRSVADSIASKCPNYQLLINDMSLPNGGGYDINGGWDANTCPNCSGHETHRLGTNADVGLYHGGVSVILSSDTTRTYILQYIIRRVAGEEPGDEIDDANHYHIK